MKKITFLLILNIACCINTGYAQTVTTFAGSGALGFVNATGTAAVFYNPCGVAMAPDGGIYVADKDNHCIRKITPDGVVTTVAGNGNAGYVNGSSSVAQFSAPSDLTVAADGTIYVADTVNHCIRKITTSGEVTTLAGNGTFGYADGTGTAALFTLPNDVAIAPDGTVIVADRYNQRIRKITADGVVTTFAGSTTGYADGLGTAAKFSNPQSVALDTAGNIFVADEGNHRIRKITPDGEVTTVAGSGIAGTADGPGTTAQFFLPMRVDVDAQGNLFVADQYNHRIRQITANGVVSTVAGSSDGYADGIGTAAQFSVPRGIAVAPDGTLYVGDQWNHRIRKITGVLNVADYQLENQVILYPNPASEIIHLDLKEVTVTGIILFDLNGRMLQSINTIEISTAINIVHLVSGIYIMQIMTNKGTISKKIVKE